MKYQGFMPNDFVNGEGISVSLWVSGCHFKCPGCHNKEAWDFESGYEIPSNLYDRLDAAITANGIQRNFSVLGGEPLAAQNRQFVNKILTHIRNKFPSIKIYLWTGYTKEELELLDNKDINAVLNNVDVLIEGRYKQEERDITLPLRGSRNQRILYKGEF